MLLDRFARHLRGWVLPLAALGLAAMVPTSGALAQSIAAVVNGDPITTSDIEQQMLFLRIMHKAASRNDALEDLIADRLKLKEAQKYGMDASDADLSTTLTRVATQANMTSASLSTALQNAKANTDIIRTHLRAVAAWNNYVRARNKSLNVSEAEVDAALAKNAGKGHDSSDYTLQEVVFVVPTGASGAVLEERLREAQSLRARFQDCGSGLALARALPDVAIKPAIRRDAKSMGDAARKELDSTHNGHLTAPQRTTAGLQMIAVCGRDDDIDKTSIRDNVQADLMADRLVSIGDQMYKQLRATAVVDRH